MLHEFLTVHQVKLIDHCQTLAAARGPPRLPSDEMRHGVPIFLNQLIDTLRSELDPGLMDEKAEAATDRTEKPQATQLSKTATEHGRELFERGYTFDQVVHAYGDVCQAVTELANDRDAPIAAREIKILNHCLDDAIAAAVTELARKRYSLAWESSKLAMDTRLRDLMQGLRVDLDRRETIALQRLTTSMSDADGQR